jgi:hypothetical protein
MNYKIILKDLSLLYADSLIETDDFIQLYNISLPPNETTLTMATKIESIGTNSKGEILYVYVQKYMILAYTKITWKN